MKVFSRLPDELTPVPDTSDVVSVISELCEKPPVNVFRVLVFLKETPNDHLLFVLTPAAKNLNGQRHSYFQDGCSRSARIRMPNINQDICQG
jgi:hypothetical protein